MSGIIQQMLHIRLSETSGQSLAEREAEIFSEPFLLRRPYWKP
ncbi:MAG: hypothetical protein R2865_11185 [Deinococcales bacterium]